MIVDVAEQTLQTRTVASRDPTRRVQVEATGVLAGAVLIDQVCEIRGYRALVGHGGEERQACLLAEQAHASDRGLGAIEQKRLVDQRGGSLDLHGAGVLFPVQAESGELALGF